MNHYKYVRTVKEQQAERERQRPIRYKLPKMLVEFVNSYGSIEKCRRYYLFGVIFLSFFIVIQFHQTCSIRKFHSYSIPIIHIEINLPDHQSEIRSKSLDNQCNQNNSMKSDLTKSSSIHLTRVYPWLHAALFPIQSQSLMYCAIPKVASKTLVSLMIYVYVRDTIQNLTRNGTKPYIDQTQTQQYINIPRLIKELNKNGITVDEKSQESNSLLSLIETYLHILRFETVNDSLPSIFLNPWRFSIKDVFPQVHFTSLKNLSDIFSPSFTRVLFVRHPFERLASAYKERIATLDKDRIESEPYYDNVRKTICRRFSKRNRIQHLPRPIIDQCLQTIPSFENFVQYILINTETSFGIARMDRHWQPYSTVCQVCKFQYNFIGKYETFDDDFHLLLKRLNVSDWNIKRRRRTSGHKTGDYQQLYSALLDHLICQLKRLYKEDFQLFNYRTEDYVNRIQLIR
ncbi:unnamed protein product [Adineta ricciae]|uniref:Carbohydrate sulfotransferase n=1 Tax=Adineta ricciae TaxID=249248 RepID=A0A815RPX3_ADIRI|nr:unnamed protein product [Adineta ricciae]